MFKKLSSKLGNLNMGVRIAVLFIAVALVTGATGCGKSKDNDTPVVSVQETPQPEEKQEQPKTDEEREPQIDDPILDVEDAKRLEKEQKGEQNFFENLIDTVTGNKKEEGSDAPWYAPVRYLVQFETNGGTEITDKVVLAGTKFEDFPTPYKESHIFLGWYYDKQLTKPVASSDQLWEKTKLYASYLEQEPLETIETVNFASATDVDKNFAITVLSSDPNMTADDVLAAIDADDLTDPNAKDVITVSKTADTFTIKGNGGFKEGGSYRIALTSDKLTFQDQPESTRQFNFTVYREEVMNLTMQDDILYLPLDQVSNIINNGDSVATLDLALYETDGEHVTISELSKGSFTYNGTTTLKEDDIVCVYEGEIPTNRNASTPKDQLGDMGYLQITGVDGSTYTYESAEAEDVLFMPDVLPMPATADTDSDANTITVENKYLDYSADIYSYNNLDSQTTADVGDFFAFYTGDYGITSGENMTVLDSYGKITAVQSNDNDTTTITYIVVTWEEIESCMDVYATEAMSGAELLEGVDTSEMEAEIEQQAIDSGFAEEAALYLTSLSLATDNFNALSENMNLEDYKVTLKDGTAVSPEQLKLMSGGEVNVEIIEKSVKAKVGTRPTHLGNIAGTSADEKGLAITLDVSVVFTIASEDADGFIEIAVTGSFVEEFGVDFGVSADAIWDVAFIIPYISDIRVSANVDTMNFTGVTFNATMITKEEGNDNVSAVDLATEIKSLLNTMANGGSQSDDTQEKLVQSYSKMVGAETDWVRIIEYNITEVKKSVPFGIPLININFSVDFVVDMDASISVGFDFAYMEGKRHVFTVEVRDRNVYSDTIDLQEKTYEFTFYSMGRIRLKAGVEMEFSISVISASLGSVGFEAGAGAYTNLYGYFYYNLKYAESQGKSTTYSGAIKMDVGIYANLGFTAQALGGKYSSRAYLLDHEWPLYDAGRRDNVLDFALEQKEIPEIVMKQFVHNVPLPDDFFNMDYLDLLTGEEKTAVYNDWKDPERANDFRNGENFVITMTNNKFTYDPKTNTVYVNPDEGDLKVTGEMIITWKKHPTSFSSKPIRRVVPLYWDNLRDGYMIVPYTNGGSYVPIIVKNFEQKVTKPADPEKLGYNFAGWYSDAALTTPYAFPEIMPAGDISVYAKWEPKTDIPYTVEHYQENFRSGEYELLETETFTGTTDTYVTPEVKSFVGYISPAQAELKINADGSSTLRYYYNLERHNITFDAGQIDGVDVTAETDITYNLKYGAPISVPQMAMKGYSFAGWTLDGSPVANVTTVVGTEDITYTATWTKNDDTPYRIEYYVQQADGRYTLQHMIKEETATGKVFTESYLRSLAIDGTMNSDQKFLIDNAIVFENMTVKGIACTKASIDGDGKTVIKINYARVKHALTFDLNYDGSEPVVKDVFYEAEVIVPQNVARTGYTFAGWDNTPVTIMPANTLTYKAEWTPNHYTVKFDKDAANATGEMAAQPFTYDEAQNLTANGFARSYYDFTGWAKQSAGEVVYQNKESVSNLIATDGAEVTLYAVWTPVEYSITYNANGGEHTNTIANYNVESETINLIDATRIGYTFNGWFDNEAFTGEPVTSIPQGSNGNISFFAKWTANADTAYKVEHYQEQLDGSYLLVDTDYLTGTTDTGATPALKSYTGFTAPDAQTKNIEPDGSLVVKYQYTRNSYTLTFDAAGGTVSPTSITAKYGASITLPAPTRDGYGLIGWFNGSTVFNDTSMGANNLTLVAKWEAGKITYTVNHHKQNVDGNGYTIANTENGTADMDSTVTLPINTYEGFTSPTNTTTITITSNAQENTVDYYYKRNLYDISWDLGIGSADGQNYTSGTIYYGTDVVAPVPAKTGYSYQWNETPVATMPAKNLAYTANWTANIYKVSFNTNNGTVTSGEVAQREVAYDATYGALADMAKTGYTFDGWFDGDAKITADTILNKTSDHTLTAGFTPITYAITYNNVVAGEHTNPATYTVEDAFALTAPTGRTGYTFEGWFDNASFEGTPIAKIEKGTIEDKTFYAKWTENSYTVTFHAYNGSAEEETRTLLYTDVLGENIFDRAGYTFLGWSDGISETTYATDAKLSTIVTSDTTSLHLYAAWEKQKYNITYINVESNEHENAIVYTVEDTVFLGEPYARPGYTFRGWFDNAACEGTAIDTINVGSTGDKAFYALWTENSYTVVLNTNDGTGAFITTEPILYTGNLPANTFVRSGYTFKGWSNGDAVYSDLAGISEIIAHANGNNQITLHAVWEMNKYTITYSNWNIGSDANPNADKTAYNAESESDIVLLDPVAKAGYQFLGWYEGDSKVTTIQKTAGKDYNLTAKWAHGGTYSIAYKTYRQVSGGYEVDFTITRTLPEGTVPTEHAQVVYVRTVNGTAYGTTPETFGITGQDKYHFAHTNPAKEGSGMVIFTSANGNGSTKTITIKEADQNNANYISASYQSTSTKRYYNVEIYKVFDATGTCAGNRSTTDYSVKKNLTAGYYSISDIYDYSTYTCYVHNYFGDPTTLWDSSYSTNISDYAAKADLNTIFTNSGISSAKKAYLNLTGISKYEVALRYDFNAKGAGKINVNIYDSDLNLLKEFDVTVKKGTSGTNRSPAYTFTKSSNQVLRPLFTIVYTGSSGVYVSNVRWLIKPIETAKPVQQGLAPMALTEYKTGEQITFTVIYNEVVHSASNLSFNLPSALSGKVSNVKYVTGTGTNALVFTGTVTSDFRFDTSNNSTVNNEAIINYKSAVSGTVKDYNGY